MKHSENLQAMSNHPEHVDMEYLQNMAETMRHYENITDELEAELQQALDCCKRVGELEQELAESKEHYKHYEQHYKTTRKRFTTTERTDALPSLSRRTESYALHWPQYANQDRRAKLSG